MGHRLNIDEYIGKKFNILTIIKEAEPMFFPNSGGKNRRVLCQCDCGNTRETNLTKVINGTQKSCGCLIHKNRSGNIYGGAFNLIFQRYKKRAVEYKRDFLLTEHQFNEFILGNCFYCGSPPISVSKPRWGSSLTYNGIDRIDSSKGYSVDNCVSCCVVCNRMKTDHNVNFFLNHISKIKAENRENKENLILYNMTLSNSHNLAYANQ